MSDEQEVWMVLPLPGWGNKESSLDALLERLSNRQRRTLAAEAADVGRSPKEHLRWILEWSHKNEVPPPDVRAAIAEVLTHEDKEKA